MSSQNIAPRIVVLASGGGATLQALLDAIANGALNAQIVLVVSNISRSGAMARAQAAGVPTLHLSARTHADPQARDQAMTHAAKAHGASLVVLAGYLKKLGPQILAAFAGRIVNTHPSLLPDFGGPGMFGKAVHEAVIEARPPESGATIHQVDGEYDNGEIIAQAVLPLAPDETASSLEGRIKALEQGLLVRTIAEHSSTFVPAAGAFALRPARPADAAALAAIELAAAQIFPLADLPAPVRDETTPLPELVAAAEADRILVATSLTAPATPLGYILLDQVDSEGHIAQMDVHPDAARRGIGRTLLVQGVELLRARGFTHVSLTTFEHIPWNAPFYASIGFQRVTPPAASELGGILAAQRAAGLQHRIAMRIALVQTA